MLTRADPALIRARQPEQITERPRAPSGVAAFMSVHSKTPYITPGMIFSSEKGVARGRGGQQLGFALAAKKASNPESKSMAPVSVRWLTN